MQPMGQSKRRRIDGMHGSATGCVAERLIGIEVLSISGECMLTLNVADSMLGRELWKNTLDKLPFKPGRQLVLSHNTSKLVLHESLQQQGFRSERERGVSYLHASQFAGCLAFCPRTQRWRWRVHVERNCRSDRGQSRNACLAAKFAQEPSQIDICT